MRLNNLLIRERLNLLVLLPLFMVLVLTVPFVADRLDDARQAGLNAELAGSSRQVSGLVRELSGERARSVVYVLTPESPRAPLVAQSQAVDDEIARVRGFYGGRPPERLADALTGLGSLDRTREDVLARGIDAEEVNDAFGAAVTSLIDALERITARADSASARHYTALEALLRAEEQGSRAAITTMGVLLRPDLGRAERERALRAIGVDQRVEELEASRFRSLAERGQTELLDRVDDGPAAQRLVTFYEQLDRAGAQGASDAERAELASQIFTATETKSALRRIVQDKITLDAGLSSQSETRARLTGFFFAALAVALFVAAVFLSVSTARSIARPLRRLTRAAGQVADLAQAELMRVSDEETEEEGPPQLAAIDLDTRDEIGDLADAVNRVQAAATLLLERQVSSRKNIAAMFGSVGHRTQNLVERQISMIDGLERDEQDTAVLERLYRLDHVSARLRRHAESLLVLSGRSEQGVTSAPLPVADCVRAALGGIEDYRRISLTEVDDVRLSAAVADDMVLLIAELLDNATSFSPPFTRVEVSALRTADGCRITIVDHGVGMNAGQLAEENERMVRRERIDLAPTDVLGLFVVGRLCRRHGLRTVLSPTPEGGVTAEVTVPPEHLVLPEGHAPEGSGQVKGLGTAESRGPGPGPGGRGAKAPAGGGLRAAPPLPVTPVAPDAPGASGAGPVPVNGGAATAPDGPRLASLGVVGAQQGAGTADAAPGALGGAGTAVPPGPPGPPGGTAGADGSGGAAGSPDPGPYGPSGLVRRVRGAQLPDMDSPADAHDTAPSVLSSAPSAPEAVSDLIERFEAGAQRALREQSPRSLPSGGHLPVRRRHRRGKTDRREQTGQPEQTGRDDRPAPPDALPRPMQPAQPVPFGDPAQPGATGQPTQPAQSAQSGDPGQPAPSGQALPPLPPMPPGPPPEPFQPQYDGAAHPFQAPGPAAPWDTGRPAGPVPTPPYGVPLYGVSPYTDTPDGSGAPGGNGEQPGGNGTPGTYGPPDAYGTGTPGGAYDGAYGTPDAREAAARSFDQEIEQVRRTLERVAESGSQPGQGGAADASFRWFGSWARQEDPGRMSGYDLDPPADLPRRVPGAQLSAAAAAPVQQSPLRPAAEHDPDAARSLIEEFEAGVAHAREESPEQDRPPPGGRT